MLNLAQLLARETPPAPTAGRVVKPLGAPDPDEIDDQPQFRCAACNHMVPADGYTWYSRRGGKRCRHAYCRACRAATNAQAWRDKAAAKRMAKAGGRP